MDKKEFDALLVWLDITGENFQFAHGAIIPKNLVYSHWNEGNGSLNYAVTKNVKLLEEFQSFYRSLNEETTVQKGGEVQPEQITKKVS